MDRKIASALFATPPVSSYEEALSYFEQADKIEPKFRRNLMFMADTYLNLKRPGDARASLERLCSYPPVSNIDRDLVAQAEQKLRKL
jgi:predicted Zn-dependent protease